jgi:uncharacterized spore protein YtfJ
MDKQIESLIEGHRDAVTVKRVFGEPYERNGVTVIPAASVVGGVVERIGGLWNRTGRNAVTGSP